jgi:hypothetical protein
MTNWKNLHDMNPEPSLLDAIAYAEDGLAYLVERDLIDYNTVYVTHPDGKIEVWHDHAFNGSGCNNWRIEVNGEQFDLEFCRTYKG